MSKSLEPVFITQDAVNHDYAQTPPLFKAEINLREMVVEPEVRAGQVSAEEFLARRDQVVSV